MTSDTQSCSNSAKQQYWEASYHDASFPAVSVELKLDVCIFSTPRDIGQYSEYLDIRMEGVKSKSERNIVKERNGLGCTVGTTLACERPEVAKQ